ncbi:hypothetical protein H2200_005384 [Cladophialophora chaetospira]|uniref:Heterokaryon incompatibility domain-containing protein n=1 Tax=Cladophialophora chaetospira TaxID=386627 RepID=A0AA39CJJ4_9EURO|nr:hypothetical protein H2200_005384 [Cladophialophora chaetospira]
MNHLPIPKLSNGPHVVVPYICTQHYQGGPFLDYPKTRSIDIKWFYSRSRACEDTLPLCQFLQEWFFFGLIQEMYGQFHITDDDFISTQEAGTQVLDTSRLNCLATEWIRLHSLEKRRRRGEQLLTPLEHIAEILDSAFSDADIESHRDFLRSIYALGIHVEAVALLEVDLHPLFSQAIRRSSRIIHVAGTVRGACLASHNRCFSADFTLGYYVSLLRQEGDRSLLPDPCNLYRCPRHWLPTESYRMKHYCSSGGCPFLTVDQNAVLELLQQGIVPGVIISNSAATGAVHLELADCADHVGYVAISHVWADGLGNPDSNALPSCQVLRLFDVLSKLHQNYSTPKVFWLDTLCCPVGQGRDLAISFMHRTYQEASAVLVLDSSLEAIEIDGMDPAEILSRILLSPWMRRLWVLQEGYLAKKLYFQFKDEACNGAKVVLAVNVKQRWRFPFMGTIMGRFLQIRSPTLYVLKDGEERIPLVHFMQSFQYRSTTVAGDEPLCLATILDFSETSVRQIAEIPRSKVQERMKTFWQRFGEIPPHILCFSGRKMQEKGFRWAPLTFMQPNSDLCVSHAWPSAPRAILTSSGLCMKSLAFTMKRPQAVDFGDHATTPGRETPFFFRHQQQEWYFVILVMRDAGRQEHFWLTWSAVTDLVLIPAGEVSTASESSTGRIQPSVQPTYGVAALVEEDDISEDVAETDRESTTCTTVPFDNDSNLQSMYTAARLLSIGCMIIAKVHHLSHIQELEFCHRNRHLSKAALIEARQQQGFSSKEEITTAASACNGFFNVTGESETKTWCFT